MCQRPDKNILFCTCDNDADNENDLDIQWTLYRHIFDILTKEKQFLTSVGMAKIPSKLIGKNLTSDNVLGSLNSSQAFDFDYQPMERDFLHLLDKNGQMFFNYTGKLWETCEGFYANHISMASGKTIDTSKVSTREKAQLKKLWTEQELIEKAEGRIRPEAKISRIKPNSRLGQILRLLGIKN